MKRSAGSASGLAFSAIGTVVGVYFAWHGFSSAPYDGQELGMFFGVMGAIVGCTCTFIGAFWGHWQKRSEAFAPHPVAQSLF